MKSAFSAANIGLQIALGLLCFAPVAGAAENSPTAMTDAMTDEKTPPPAIVPALEKATDGLQMMSETDAPFKVVFFALETEKKAEEPDARADRKERAAAPKLSAAQIAKLAGAPDDATIETRELDEFFEAVATVEDWMNDEEKASAQRFAALLELLKTGLKNAQVVVWGEAEKQVAIVGECEGGAAGVTTLIVET